MKRNDWWALPAREEVVGHIPERREKCRTCGQKAHVLQATHDDEPVNRLALLGVVVIAMTFWVIAGALVWALLMGGAS